MWEKHDMRSEELLAISFLLLALEPIANSEQ